MLDNMNYYLQPIKVIFLPFFSFFLEKTCNQSSSFFKEGEKKKKQTNTKSYASYPSHLEAMSERMSSEHCRERLETSCFNIAPRSDTAGAGS